MVCLKWSHILLKLLFLLLKIVNIFEPYLCWQLLVFLRQELDQFLVAPLGIFLGVLGPLLLEEVKESSQGLLGQVLVFLVSFASVALFNMFLSFQN